MNIGVFDSGLGGLIILQAIRKIMPSYDYVYLGDTKRVPYGNRSEERVFTFTREAVDYLFRKESCAIVIIACNTASARALRKIQKEYLPKKFPDRKVLGVLIPAAEECVKFRKVGILATRGTVHSGTFPKEIKKLDKKIKVFQYSAPMLAQLAEEGKNTVAIPFIKKYLKSFSHKKLDALVLGCTHYPFLKKPIQKMVGKKVKLLDGGVGIAGRARSLLKSQHMANIQKKKGETVYFTTSDPIKFSQVATFLLKHPIEAKKVKI